MNKPGPGIDMGDENRMDRSKIEISTLAQHGRDGQLTGLTPEESIGAVWQMTMESVP